MSNLRIGVPSKGRLSEVAADLLKQAYQHAVAHMKELSDLIRQSNTEALALLNKRFAEAMDEVKALAEKAR